MEMTEATKQRLAKAMAWIDEHRNDSQDELRKQFSSLAEQFNTEISGLSEIQFDFKPSEKDWSVREVCLHISHSMRERASAIETLASGTTLPDYAAPGELDEDPGEQSKIVTNVETAFQKVLNSLSCLDGTEDLDATFKHPFFGPINSRQTAAFNILHLTIHVNQVRRVKGYDEFAG